MDVAGVVLAAGASRRMGHPKALLRLGGQTFLERLLAALAQGGCRPLRVVVAEPHGEAVRQACGLPAEIWVDNPEPARGQISSLRCALDALPDAAAVLVATVDQAGIAPETVAEVRRGLSRAPLSVARHAGVPGHPVAFAAELFAALRSPVCDGGARLLVERLAAEARVAWADVDDPGVVRNLNRPADYRALLGEPEDPPPDPEADRGR